MNIDDDKIDAAVKAHHAALSGIWSLIRKARSSKDLTEEERDAALTRLYAPLSTKDIQQHFVSDGQRYDIGVSYRSSMANMMRLKKRMRALGYSIAPGGNSKLSDLQFGKSLGIPVARTLATKVPTEELNLSANTIVKPMQGSNSRGVFWVQDDLSLYSVRSRETYSHFEDALQELPAAKQTGNRVRWMVEDAVLDGHGNLAPDMKVYMFYGQPGLYIEIERGAGPNGKNLYATFDAEANPRRINNRYTITSDSSVPSDVVEKARRLSENTPTPFLRIDFLSGVDGCVLGEITPHPGDTYAGDFLDDVDRELGEHFLEAEARLQADLINGKSFEPYFQVYRSARPRVRLA